MSKYTLYQKVVIFKDFFLKKIVYTLKRRRDQTPRRDMNLGDGRHESLQGNLKEVRVRARRGQPDT